MAWDSVGMTPKPKHRMEMTEENFYRVLDMRDELIDEMRVEISKLKMKVNKLQQKVTQHDSST